MYFARILFSIVPVACAVLPATQVGMSRSVSAGHEVPKCVEDFAAYACHSARPGLRECMKGICGQPKGKNASPLTTAVTKDAFSCLMTQLEDTQSGPSYDAAYVFRHGYGQCFTDFDVMLKREQQLA
ncbi:hypothetical protein BKA62DRAFT_722280 [Auriculariales sp. MPI-PUGE-AT-0066]|nr:hypothetical protein BKA62DRAFT_722280 [Auriculariales sp. MPI-PUGE-AT-0066]